jgi:hypothetical protein
VDGTGSKSCRLNGFAISGVELSVCARANFAIFSFRLDKLLLGSFFLHTCRALKPVLRFN